MRPLNRFIYTILPIYSNAVDNVKPADFIRKVWIAGSDKGISYCISIPIELARKYGIQPNDYVAVSDTKAGILVRRVTIVEGDNGNTL